MNWPTKTSIFVVILLLGTARAQEKSAADEEEEPFQVPEAATAVYDSLGVDGAKLVEACLHDKESRLSGRALALTFWLATNGGFDGESATGQASILGHILRNVGDARFTTALQREPETVRMAIARYLRDEFGLYEDFRYPDRQRDFEEFHRRFPQTAKLLGIES